MKTVLYCCLYACVSAALCLVVVEPASAQTEQKRVNLLKRKNNENTSKREIKRPINDQVLTAFQSVGDPDRRSDANWQMFLHYSLFLVGTAAVIACLLYWQYRQRKKTEWELIDPMALVKELSFAHQLSDQEKQLMQEVSNRNSLPSPLQIFVEPKFLLEIWEDDSYILSQPLVRRLLTKLFDINVGGSEISPDTMTNARGI